jgi:Flp pilus assembly protein TadG
MPRVSPPPGRRRGAVILEFSLVFPVLFLLTLGTIVLSLGVSQYQTAASLAREGARWASVHGAEYQQTTGNPAASAADVYTQGILPHTSTLTCSQLTYSVTWSPNNKPGSTVSVMVNYHYEPSAYLGAIDVSSTSVMTIEY